MTSPAWCFWLLAVPSAAILATALGRLLGAAIAAAL